MRVSVVVVPLFLMKVAGVLRGDPLEGGREVVSQARLEFDRRYCGCRADDEKMDDANIVARVGHRLLYLVSNVDQIVFTPSAKLKLMVMDHGATNEERARKADLYVLFANIRSGNRSVQELARQPSTFHPPF